MPSNPKSAASLAEEAKMATCKHALDCSMYSQFGRSGLLDIWKQKYCNGKYEDCVRYQLTLIGEPVSPAMLPNGKMLR